MSISLEKIQKDLKTRLSNHRYAHTESVVESSLKIYDSLDLGELKETQIPNYRDKIELAAWLHDACKELSNQELIDLAKFYKIEIFEEDYNFPNLLHARVGAAWVEDEYEIPDPYILKAIEEHTLGGEKMFLSSKIVFLADMIEAKRKNHNELEEIREITYEEKNLNKAIITAMDTKIKQIIDAKKLIHPLSIKARNAFLKLETLT